MEGTPEQGWVLYDDACGLCRRGVGAWAGTLRRYGMEPCSLHAPWVRAKLGLSNDQVLSDFRLLLTDGGQYHGAEAYRQILRRIPWGRPLYQLSRLPLLSGLFDAGYRWVAARRHRLSQACGLRAPFPRQSAKIASSRLRGDDRGTM